MILNKLSELIGRKRLKIKDVVDRTGLARNTVTELYYARAKMVTLETLDKLCNGLDCRLDEIIEYIPDPDKEEENT